MQKKIFRIIARRQVVLLFFSQKQQNRETVTLLTEFSRLLRFRKECQHRKHSVPDLNTHTQLVATVNAYVCTCVCVCVCVDVYICVCLCEVLMTALEGPSQRQIYVFRSLAKPCQLWMLAV